MKVLVLTTEPLPLPGLAASGAGLRAWGLAFGLRTTGIDQVVLGFAADSVRGQDIPEIKIPDVHTFERSELAGFIDQQSPDVIVLQHWGLVNSLSDLKCPLAIDLAGPHLLERALWGSKEPLRDQHEKIEALSRADFVVCSGKYQRHYFLPFLIEAGFQPHENLCPVIPFSVSPSLPSPAKERDLSSVLHAGFFLPWQDPTKSIQWSLDTMKEKGKGQLRVVGGAHPSGDVSGGQYDELLDELERNESASLESPMAFDELVQVMRRCGVALDLFPRNLERELAFPTRTINYMWAGLPVIHNNYDEIAPLIEQYKAGWTVDPENENELKRVLRRILSHPSDLEKRGENARQLVRDHFSWDKTIGPLAEFCQKPQIREDKRAAKETIRIRSQYYGMQEPEIRKKPRGKRSTSPGKITWSPGQGMQSPNRFQQALAPVAMLFQLILGAVLLLIFGFAEIARFLVKNFAPSSRK